MIDIGASPCIELDAAIDAVFKLTPKVDDDGYCWVIRGDVARAIDSIPAADVRPVVKAKWEDVHIDRPEIADLEVASMFCPNCNRWHNEVYQYGNPIESANFCQFCGADMRPTSMSGANGEES